MNQQTHASLTACAANEIFTYYPLPGLLPEGALVVFNPVLGTLACLRCDHEQDGPRLMAEQQFTPNEVCLLRPLLAAYPDYCAYEVLHASFYGPPNALLLELTDPAVARSRTRLEKMRRQGIGMTRCARSVIFSRARASNCMNCRLMSNRSWKPAVC